MVFRQSVCRLVTVFMLGTGINKLAVAEPNTTGQTGLINMPDARMDEDGSFRFGASYFRPYLPAVSYTHLRAHETNESRAYAVFC